MELAPLLLVGDKKAKRKSREGLKDISLTTDLMTLNFDILEILNVTY